MTVKNMTFMIDRLGADCAPLQYVRELTENGLAAIETLPSKTGEIAWDVEWKRYALEKIYKLSVIDTGVGMTGPEMVEYINKLSSSVHLQTAATNYGVGAKIAAAPRNKAGLIYLSWKDGVGSMVHLWRDPDADVYGLRQFHRGEEFDYWTYVGDEVKPPQITDHGTMVVLMGNDIGDDTMRPPEGTPMPSRWILRYLNSRYFQFPEGLTVKAREGWELPQGDSHNFLRTVTGMRPWLDQSSEASGTVDLTNATARWWILKADLDVDSGHYTPLGHAAALYQDELYETATGKSGASRLQSFGLIFGYQRVVIYVEPRNAIENEVTPNTARTSLLMNGEPLPWTEWAGEFRDRLPEPIVRLMEEVGGKAASSDHRQSIRERLKLILDLFKISRYRPATNGSITMDDDSAMTGGKPKELGGAKKDGTGEGGGRGGRAGDIYSLFLASRGIPGEEFELPMDPDRKWVNAADGTRIPPDMEDRAAKYLPAQNLLLINADFRIFTDMITRWTDRYEDRPGVRTTVEQVVREWFEQQLVEAILGGHSLRGSREWTVQDLETLWSQESLTAVVLPRYHIDYNIKRVLGSKLGAAPDRTRAAS